MASNESTVPFELGTPDACAWKARYKPFGPKGIGWKEPGFDASDSAALSAFNIVKSAYQIRPEVFNMKVLSKELGLPAEEICSRMKRMYDERLIMYCKNSALQTTGFGLYYWAVKLTDEATPEFKAQLADWFQNKDDICTGYETEGCFDFFNGNHMRVLDNLLASIMKPWWNDPRVAWVHICPIRRDIRESGIGLWDAPEGDYREFFFTDEQMEKLAASQSLADLTDLKIISALNKKRPMADVYDFDVLADISGLDPDKMRADIAHVVEDKHTFVPVFYVDYPKLGIKQHMFFIRTFQTLPSYRKAEIADELCKTPEFNTILEFTDAQYDMTCWAYSGISDIDALRARIDSYSEVEDIIECESPRQFRRWTCRVDDDTDNWEECVFTDDFLEDRTIVKNPAKCRFCSDGASAASTGKEA